MFAWLGRDGLQLVAFKGRFVLRQDRAAEEVLGYLFIHQTLYRGGYQRFEYWQ